MAAAEVASVPPPQELPESVSRKRSFLEADGSGADVGSDTLTGRHKLAKVLPSAFLAAVKTQVEPGVNGGLEDQNDGLEDQNDGLTAETVDADAPEVTTGGGITFDEDTEAGEEPVVGSTTASPRGEHTFCLRISFAAKPRSREDYPRPSDDGNMSELPGAGASASFDEATSCYGYFQEEEDPGNYSEDDIARISRILHAPTPTPDEINSADLAAWEDLQEPASGGFDIDDCGQVLESSDSHLGYLIEASDDQLGIPPSPSAVGGSPSVSTVDGKAHEDFYMTFDEISAEVADAQATLIPADAAPDDSILQYREHVCLEPDSTAPGSDSLAVEQPGDGYISLDGLPEDAEGSDELLLQASACLDSDFLEMALGQFCNPGVRAM